MTRELPATVSKAEVTIAAHSLADHHSVVVELLRRAKQRGLAGATVVSEGGGATLVIIAVDERARLDEWLAGSTQLLATARVVVTDDVVAHRAAR